MVEEVSEGTPLVTVSGLRKVYLRGTRVIPVLTGLELNVARGDMIGVIGASGVGKTTLLQVIGTLDEPTSGSVQYEGVNPFELPDRERARFRRRNS